MPTPSPSELLRQPQRAADTKRGSPEQSPAERSDSSPGATLVPRAPRRKRRSGLIIGVVIALLAIGTTLAVMFATSGRKTGIPVETVEVSRRTIVQTVMATGIVDPETQVKISSEVSGEIVHLGVEEGQHVQRGALLVRINPQVIVAQTDEARAAISGARAREAQSKAALLRSQQDLDRTVLLFDRKLSTSQELDAARAAVNIAKAELQASEYGTQQAQASLRRIQESLGKTSIYAPISGVVTKLNSKLGEKVVGAIQMTGTEIMTIADLSVIEAVVDVSETDVVAVSAGDTADVEVDAIPGQHFTAYVSRIANSPKQTGIGQQDQVTNFEVRVRFVTPDQRLRPGMTATATIRVARKGDVLAVPIQSVTTRDTTSRDDDRASEGGATNRTLERAIEARTETPKPVVFIRQGDSVVMVPVTTGIRDNEFIEIASGLKGGERVVSGSYKAITKDLEDRKSVVDMPKENKEDRSGEGGR